MSWGNYESASLYDEAQEDYTEEELAALEGEWEEWQEQHEEKSESYRR